jgi:hypothetical protein
VSDRPEPLARLDLLFEAARIAHETSFGLHRRLVALGADDDHTRRLLAESAAIALENLAAVTAQARQLATRWEEQSVLNPEAADRTVQDVRAELDRAEPALGRLRARQREIARELGSRLAKAAER